MRRVNRAALPTPVAVELEALQTRVNGAPDRKAEAEARWRAKPSATFGVVQDTLADMANGRSRCMYCEDSAGKDIEHFWPKSSYPDRAFVWENYLWACSACNSTLKGARFPLDGSGAPLLIDPTDPKENPADHLMLIPGDGRYAGRSAKGKETIDVFDLNSLRRRDRLPDGRKNVLDNLQHMILRYHQHTEAGRPDEAAALKRRILDEPFSAVREHLLRLAESPKASTLLERGVPEAIVQHGIAAW